VLEYTALTHHDRSRGSRAALDLPRNRHYLSTGENSPTSRLRNPFRGCSRICMSSTRSTQRNGIKSRSISLVHQGARRFASFRHCMNQLETATSNSTRSIVSSSSWAQNLRLRYQWSWRMRQTTRSRLCPRSWSGTQGPRRGKAGAIYDMVLKNVERPMLELVLDGPRNQSIAAEMLGINRNTCERKSVAQNKM